MKAQFFRPTQSQSSPSQVHSTIDPTMHRSSPFASAAIISQAPMDVGSGGDMGAAAAIAGRRVCFYNTIVYYICHHKYYLKNIWMKQYLESYLNF